MTDLNSLVPAGSPFLIYANDINELGEIAGQACNPDQCAAGVTFAFLAIPDHDAESSSTAHSEKDQDKKVQLPKSLREQLRAQWGVEFADDK